MRKANRRKTNKRRIKQPNLSPRTTLCHADPYSPEGRRFRDLNAQYEANKEFLLRPEEYERDLDLFSTFFMRAIGSHLQLIIPDLLRECMLPHYGVLN
jgi:hypothetical protein